MHRLVSLYRFVDRYTHGSLPWLTLNRAGTIAQLTLKSYIEALQRQRRRWTSLRCIASPFASAIAIAIAIALSIKLRR